MDFAVGKEVNINGKKLVITDSARGGTATVFFAEGENGRRYVIKKSNLNPEESERERLIAGYAANASTKSPYHWEYDSKTGVAYCGEMGQNAVSLKEYQESEKYLANPKISTLQRCLAALRVIYSLLLFADTLHSFRSEAVKGGIVHFDLSYTNVFVSPEDQTAYVIDFGSARIMPENGKLTVSREKAPYGTNPFVSTTRTPNSFREYLVLDCTEDLYSIGMVLFCMLADESVYSCGYKGSLFSKNNCAEMEPFIHGLNVSAGVKKSLLSFFKKACAEKAGDRFQSASDMRSAVKELIEITEGRGIHEAIAHEKSAEYFGRLWGASYSYGNFCDELICNVGCVDGDFVESFNFENFSNSVLVGAGGMGKTTLALRIWKKLLDGWKTDYDTAPLPLYIPLYTYNARCQSDADNARCQSDADYIKHEIYKRYFCSQAETSENADDYALQIYSFLKNKPCLLILDGINESSHAISLSREIHELADISSVRVLILSRTDYSWLSAKTFEKRQMLPLSKETVTAFLTRRGFNEAVDAEMLELLKTPMYLTIFSRIMPALENDAKEIKTAGQLFMEQDRWLIRQRAAANNREDEELFAFLIDEFLPSVANCSAGRTFSVNVRDNSDNKEILGFLSAISAISYECSNGREISKLVDDYLVPTGIVAKAGGVSKYIVEYVMHENLMTYYKAKYIKNDIDYVNDCAERGKEISIPESLSDSLIAPDTAKLLGDILGESSAAEGEKSPVERLLHLKDFLEQRYDKESRLATANFVEIMKASKSKISADFTRLDLRNCSFVDTCLNNCDFSRSKISKSSFFEMLDCEISDLSVTNSGDTIVVTKDNKLRIFDVKTRSCVFERGPYQSDCYRICGRFIVFARGVLPHIDLYDTDTAQIKEYDLECRIDDLRLIDYGVQQNIFASYGVVADCCNVVLIADLNNNTCIRADISHLLMKYGYSEIIAIKAIDPSCANIVLKYRQEGHTLYSSVVLKVHSGSYEIISEITRIIDSNSFPYSKGIIGRPIRGALYDLYSLSEIEICVDSGNDIVSDCSFSENRSCSVSVMTGTSTCNPRIFYSHDSDVCVQPLDYPAEAMGVCCMCALSPNGKFFCIYPQYWVNCATRLPAGSLLLYSVEQAAGSLAISSYYTIPASSNRIPSIFAYDSEHVLISDGSNMLRLFNGVQISKEILTKSGTRCIWIDSERFLAWREDSADLFRYSDGVWTADAIPILKKNQQIKSVCIANECGKAFALVCSTTSPEKVLGRGAVLELDMNGAEISVNELLTVDSYAETVSVSNDGNYLMVTAEERTEIYFLNLSDYWDPIKSIYSEDVISIRFLSNTSIIEVNLLNGIVIYDLNRDEVKPFVLSEADEFHTAMSNHDWSQTVSNKFAALNKKEGIIYLSPDFRDNTYSEFGALRYAEIIGCYTNECEIAKIGINSATDSITVSVSDDDKTAFVTMQGNRVHMINISPDFYKRGPHWYPPSNSYRDTPPHSLKSNYFVFQLSSARGMVNCRFSANEVDAELFEANGADIVY